LLDSVKEDREVSERGSTEEESVRVEEEVESGVGGAVATAIAASTFAAGGGRGGEP
jgi:hypothetical protein